MKSKERRFVLISLLLVGALSMPGGISVWANGESEMPIQEIGEIDTADEGLSDNIIEEPEIIEEESDVHDTVSGIENIVQEELSENEIKEQVVLSDNSQSSNSVSIKKVESENSVSSTDVKKKVTDVVLPTELPFDMILWGEERLKGAVRSRQFYMENKGFEDVRISIQGTCSGKKNEDYVIRDTSVEDDIVQGKKNVWIYLRWEDENGNELDQPGIVMGDASAPGKGDIILKAPERNNRGEIQGENSQSKIYFSIFGDLNSDTGSVWEDAELRLSLKWVMEELTSENAANLLDLPDESEIPEQSEDIDELESVSGNMDIILEEKSISDNADILEEERSISDNADTLEEERNISDNANVLEKISISDNTNILEGQKSISDNENVSEEQEEILNGVDIPDENESLWEVFRIKELIDTISNNADELNLLE